MRNYNKLFGAILLVSGTTIGAAMLALPVTTGMAGFFPALLLFTFYWAFMTFTALLILEATLWMREGSNLLSISKAALGVYGEIVCWIVYLFLLYALTTAYIAGGSAILIDAIQALFGLILPDWVGIAPLLLVFGFLVYKGPRSVDKANRLLMGGLALAFGTMVVFLSPHVKSELLTHLDWKFMWMGVSVVATSFGFHIIIPSLVRYLDGEIKWMRRAIIIGSLIPYIVYVSWEFLALGIIPIEGPQGLYEGFLKGSNGVHLLTPFLANNSLAMTARFFSFFAIITSFLGVSLSLSDFLADGLKIKKNRNGRLLLHLLTFLPPLIITLIDPRAFLTALEYAGAFGVVGLLGLFPALIVWSGRYHCHLARHGDYRAPGGKPALVCVILISLSVILFEAILLW